MNGEGVIVDALKRRAPADGPVNRILMPGEPYVFPADQGKADPRAITSAELETNLRLALPNQPLWKVLQDSLQGLSRTAAQEIVFRAGLSPTALRSESDEANWKGIEKALGEVVQEATQGKAAVYLSQGQGDFAAYRVFHQPFTDHASIAALVDEFYTTRTEAAKLTQLRNSLRRALDKHCPGSEKSCSGKRCECPARTHWRAGELTPPTYTASPRQPPRSGGLRRSEPATRCS